MDGVGKIFTQTKYEGYNSSPPKKKKFDPSCAYEAGTSIVRCARTHIEI